MHHLLVLSSIVAAICAFEVDDPAINGLGMGEWKKFTRLCGQCIGRSLMSGGPSGFTCKCQGVWCGAVDGTESDSAFADNLVAVHNEYRAKHGAGDLAWDNTIAQYAQAYIDERVTKMHSFTHNPEETYGENYFASSGASPSRNAVISWYNEMFDPGYTFGSNSGSDGAGHFSQVVWKASTKVGCGRGQNANNWNVVLCNYSPAGNVGSQYADNVEARSGDCNEASCACPTTGKNV